MASFVSFCCARKASVHQLEDLGETHQSLDAVVPFVFFELFVERVALPAWMGFCESCRLDHLERIRGCHEDLRQERGRILHNGRDDLLQLLGLEGTRVGAAWRLRSCGEWCKRKAQRDNDCEPDRPHG